MLSSLFTILATTTAFFIPQTAFAATLPQPARLETVQEMATRIAADHHIPEATLTNLVSSESGWNPEAVGDNGCSFGLTQINICAHKNVTKKQALDPNWNLEWAAQQIQDGTEDIYTSCNCYSLVWTLVPNLPHMADILPNTDKARIGEVAIFYYTDRETGEQIKHVAYITARDDNSFTIQEANKTHCLIDSRTIPISDPYLVGFWAPNGA